MTERWCAAMFLAALAGGWQLAAAALPQADGPLDEPHRPQSRSRRGDDRASRGHLG